MVAIFTGAGTGYERGSGNVLGGAGLIGAAALGRSGEQVMLNASNGNLLISQRDEFLTGRGPDAVVNRTYNSLGDLSDDNHDNWRQSTQRQIRELTGTANTWGSTVKRVSGDGSVMTYAWNGSAYRTTDGAGAYDTITWDGTWRWTDGDSQVVEVYGGPDNQISQMTDTSGNTITYSYAGGQLADVTTANGERIHYVWSGANLAEIQTFYVDGAWLQSTRTRYEYDGYGRLANVVVDLTPNDNSTADGARYVTSYTYVGSSKLVASITETDGTRLDIGYDGNNRVTSLAQTVANGVTRTTTIAYGTDYTLVTDPQGQTTRLDYASGNFAAEVGTWGKGGVVSEAATIDGRRATKFTVTDAGQLAGICQVFSFASGETLTFGLTLQAVGAVTEQDFGLYSDQTGWGATNVATARILSGPGQVVQLAGGIWRVVDLSATQGTRVEITRTYDQSGSGGAYFYVDNPGGYRAGVALIAADANLTRSTTGASLGQMDLANWWSGGVSIQPAGTIDGAAAYRYTVQQNGQWAGISTGFSARTGEQYSFSLSLQAVGDATSQDFGLYGDASQWGDPTWSTARIVSGPGTIVRLGGGMFRVSGLSTTQPTRIETTRTYDREEAALAHFYADNPGGFRGGASLIAGAPLVTRLQSQQTGSPGQLTKITTVAPNSGAAPQVVQFAYDAAGNLISSTTAAGTTQFVYDARGNLLQRTDPAGLSTWWRYNSANQVTIMMRDASETGGDYQSTRYAHDAANRLRFVVDADGGVTEFGIGASGQTDWTIKHVTGSYDTSGWAWDTPLDYNALTVWAASVDKSGAERVAYSYDARLNQTQMVSYGRMDSAGYGYLTDGYTHEYMTYDQAGQLLTRIAAGLNAETFVYDGLGRVKVSTDSAGATTSIVFNDAAMQTVVTLASGLVRTSSYNRAGELISQTESGAYLYTGTTANEYDALGRIRKSTDPNGVSNYLIYDKVGRKVGDVNAYGWLTEYRYDAADRLVATARYALGMDANQQAQAFNPAASPDIAALRPPAHAYDIWQWTVYDGAGRVIETIQGDGAVTRFDYDRSDRLIRTTQFATKLSQGQIDAFKAAAPNALVLPATSASDSIARTFYDRAGRVVGSLDGAGWLTRITYDKAGRKIADTVFANATAVGLRAGGTLAQLVASVGTSPQDATTRYVYDGQGNLRFTVDALNRVTEHGYQYETPTWNWGWSARGQERLTTRFAGAIAVLSSYTIDSVRQALAGAGLVGNAGNRTSYAVYDDYHIAAGRLMYEVSAAGTVIGYRYDVSGRLIRKTEYANVRATAYLPSQGDMDAWASTYANPADRVERYYYNARGELRFTIDAEGYVTRNDYDAGGQLTYTVRWSNPVAATDGWTIDTVAANQSGDFAGTSYAYNLDKQVSQVTDAVGNIRSYFYYATGKVADDILSHGQEDESRTLYIYDAAGRLTARCDARYAPEQSITRYAYDGRGNVVSVTDGRGQATTSTYDGAGQLRTVTDAAGGVTTYSYNALGEAVQVTDPRGAVTTTAYDAAGQATTITDALGYVTTTAYTVFGQVAAVTRGGATTSFEYDRLGRVTRTRDALGYEETYGYNAWGDRITSVNKLGGVTTSAYDRRGLLVSETLPVKSYNTAGIAAAQSVTNTYAYDGRGNRVTMVEAAGLTEARTTTYTYDKADRLTATAGPAFFGMTPTTHLSYDNRGNVTARIDPTGARTIYYYDDLDRVAVEISAVGTYTAHDYDANGNVTSTRVYGTAVAIPADGGAKAEAPAAPGGGYRETSFTYDALNRLTASSIAGAASGRFDGVSWVADTSPITTGYQYDAAGNVVKATDANGNVTWSWYDLLGQKVCQIDGENALTTWSYDAEGNVTWERRYATRFPGTPSLTSLPPLGGTIDDRLTGFTYDLVGNRLTETRYYVLVHNGAGAQVETAATISYLYNGAAQVVRKTEATGDHTDYSYDTGGRLTTEARAAFVDNSGTTVTPTVDYWYNGVGDLTRTDQRGSANAAGRSSLYSYYGSRLQWINDAETLDGDISNGKTTYYSYDAAGRQTYEYYQRWDSAGNYTASYEGNLTAYDAAGRVTQQWQARWDGNLGWLDTGPRTTLAYNAYGEVVSSAVGGVTQFQNEYDAAGRLAASNAGDGAWRYFGYDKNGNQTFMIASAGYNLAGAGFWNALSLVGRDDVDATYTRYDKRNMAVAVTEEGRQRAWGGATRSLTTTRAYNAFGEVASETNAAGATIDYTYNTMGRLIRSDSPWVSVTGENGVQATMRPAEHYYYDAGGRLVASRDANGNLTRRTLLAGTGYGRGAGAEGALVTSEIHADGGVTQTRYDVHGDARELIDELGYRTLQTFDKMGRIVSRQEVRDPTTAADDHTDTYVWDGLGRQVKHGATGWSTPIYGEPYWVVDDYDWETGQQIGHWETPVIGTTPDWETTDYDQQGRVTAKRAFGGDVTTVAYAWNGGLATAGLGTFGGWTQTTTMANGRVASQASDLAGRTIAKTDLGGHATGFTYDVAGRLASSTLGGMTTAFGWLNSGLLGRMTIADAAAGSQTASWTRDTATYGYDVAGNRTAETLVREHGVYTPGYLDWSNWYEPQYYPDSYDEYAETLKNQSASYDALGRLTTWSEAGAATSPAASIVNSYDAGGNVRRTQAVYRTLDANGTAGAASSRDYWFRYDAMNRTVVDQGILQNGVIVRGAGLSWDGSTGGRDIAYDVAGRRVSVTTTTSYYDPWAGYYPQDTQELYAYDAAGRLVATRERAGGEGGPGRLRSAYGYDAAGRQTSQTDYAADGQTAVYSRTAAYNRKGQLESDYGYTLRSDGKTASSSTSYGYGAGASYALGAVTSQSSSSYVAGAGGGSSWSTTTNGYLWYDGALQSYLGQANGGVGGSTSCSTSFTYDALGRLASAGVHDGKPRTVTFTNDELGQVIRRDESWVAGQTGAPHEVWYRFGGRQLGYTGNNGTSDMAMAASIEDRRVAAPTSNQGTFRNKQLYGSAYADFAQSYDPLNSYGQGSAGGSYTVQRGDTLQSIARASWGDANLWYAIAEANGLGASPTLIEGQRLTLPAGVVRTANTATTLKPYDPASALGDVTPGTAPQAAGRKGGRCGTFGVILLAVVAVAVAVATAGAAVAVAGGTSFASGISTVIGASVFGGTVAAGGVVGAVGAGGAIALGAASAAMGSIASQGLGVATGIQDKFSWSGVALAAIGGGVAGGVAGLFGQAGNPFGAAAQAAAGSAVAQGIGVATGLQSKFSWAGVAAAGIGGGAGRLVGGTSNRFGAFAGASAATLVANAATRSALEGSSFGDNMLAALPDTIANILFRAVGEAANSVQRSGNEAKRSPTDQTTAAHADANPQNTAAATVEEVADIVVTAPRHSGSQGASATPTISEPSRKAAEPLDLGSVKLSPVGRAEIADGSTRNVWRDWPAELQADFNKLWKLYRDKSNAEALIGDAFDPLAQQTVGGVIDRAALKANLGLYRAGKIHSISGGYWTTEAVSAQQQALGGFAISSAGAFTLAALDSGSMGIVGALDNRGVLGMSEARHPTAATAGMLAGIGIGFAAGGVAAIGREAAVRAEITVPQVTANRLAGNAFRDEIAGLLKAEGRDVSTEVYKSTPFGKRFIDIEVSKDGQVLGGIETKLGGSRYTPAQRAKDWWLKANDGYIVNIVRKK